MLFRSLVMLFQAPHFYWTTSSCLSLENRMDLETGGVKRVDNVLDGERGCVAYSNRMRYDRMCDELKLGVKGG